MHTDIFHAAVLVLGKFMWWWKAPISSTSVGHRHSVVSESSLPTGKHFFSPQSSQLRECTMKTQITPSTTFLLCHFSIKMLKIYIYRTHD